MCDAKHLGANDYLKSGIRERATGTAWAGGTVCTSVYEHALKETLLLRKSAQKHQSFAFETSKMLA